MADKLKLKPSTIRRPWHGYKTQANLNAERSGIPLLKVVNKEARTRIEEIRNSLNYQEAHDQNAQSALKVPKLKDVKIGRFSVSSSSVKPVVLSNGKHGRFTVSNQEPSAASASATSVASSSSVNSVGLLNGKHGRFTVSNEEPSPPPAAEASASSSAASIPSHHKTSSGRKFTISNRLEGGRRTRFHSRRNISRRRRHVGRRRTHRNGA